MDNLLQTIRRNRMFSNGQQQQPNPYNVQFNPSAPEPIQAPQVNPLDMATPMMDVYKKRLEEMPNADDYKPGVRGSIGAALSGVSEGIRGGSAYNATKTALDEPYKEASDEWSRRIAQTGALAGLEEKTNANKGKNFLDWRKEGREDRNTDSLIGYRGKQGANLDDQVSMRGRTSNQNKTTGMFETRDRNGNLLFANKNDESLNEGSARGLTDYTNKKVVDLRNDKDLGRFNSGLRVGEHATNRRFDVANPEAKNEIITNDITGRQSVLNVNDPTSAARDLGQTRETVGDKESSDNRKAQFRAELDRENAKYKSELDKMTEIQKDAAYTQAMKETQLENPNFAKFFDSSGQIDASEMAKAPDVYNAMLLEIRNKLNYKYGKKTSNPLAARPGISTPNPDQESIDQLKGQPDGSYSGSDGSVWTVKNGLATKVK